MIALTDALERELTRVSEEAAAIWERRPRFDEHEQQMLHDLWAYQKRLRFLRVLAAVADPRQPVDPDSLEQLDKRFRDAITAFGSATEDNVRAAAAVSLRLRRSPRGPAELAFEVGPSAVMLADVLLSLCDLVGTADFYRQHLSDAPELKQLTPELWEDAFRAVMLTTGALFASPRHEEAARGADGA